MEGGSKLQQRILLALHSRILLVSYFPCSHLSNLSLSPVLYCHEKRLRLKPTREMVRRPTAKNTHSNRLAFTRAGIPKYLVLNGLPKWQNRMKNAAISRAEFILMSYATALESL